MNYKELKSLMKYDGKYTKSYAEKVMERLGGYSDMMSTGTTVGDEMTKTLQDEIQEKYYL